VYRILYRVLRCICTYINSFFLIDCNQTLFYQPFFHYYAHTRWSSGTKFWHAIFHPTLSLYFRPPIAQMYIFSLLFVHVNPNLEHRHADYCVGCRVRIFIFPYIIKRPHRKYITAAAYSCIMIYVKYSFKMYY